MNSPSLPVTHTPQQSLGLPVNRPLFHFDGGALTWLGVGIGGFLVTALTLGICYPWAVVMTYRWKTKHTYLDGRQLRFAGNAWTLFGQWVKWLLLTIITLGVYSFWVYPRIQKWIVENQEIDPNGVTLQA